MEYKVKFSDGTDYELREYFDCEGEYETSIEVWDPVNLVCVYEVPGASFLDEDDEDAPLYNAIELNYIEQYGRDNDYI